MHTSLIHSNHFYPAGKWYLSIWNTVSLFFLSFVFVIVLFLSNTQYAAKQQLAEHNFIFAIIGALIGIGSYVICRFSAHLPAVLHGHCLEKVTFYTSICIFSIAALLIQQHNIAGAWFITDWDAGQAVDAVFNPSQYEWLYSYYPNNLFLISIFRFLRALFTIQDFDTLYLLILEVGAVIISVSGLLVTLTAYNISHSFKAGYCTFILVTAFIVFSPQAFIPYTDSYGMLAPVLAVYLYSSRISAPIKISLVGFVAVLGSFIKPNAIIVLIAVIIIESSKFLSKIIKTEISLQFQDLRKYVAAFVLFVLFATFACCIGNSCKTFAAKDMTIRKEWSMSPAHYLMMGWNSESGGVYNQEDVNYSLSFSNPEERKQGDLKVFRDRINDLGPFGVVKLGTKKLLSSFADGSGSWRMEGSFFVSIKGTNEVVKSYYGIGNHRPCGYTFVAQLFWVFILLGIVFQWFDKELTPTKCAVNLTLLGQGIFLLLFECRARYLVQFWPLFVLATISGWKALYQYLDRRVGRYDS